MIAYALSGTLFVLGCLGMGYCLLSLLDRFDTWNELRRERARRYRLAQQIERHLANR